MKGATMAQPVSQLTLDQVAQASQPPLAAITTSTTMAPSNHDTSPILSIAPDDIVFSDTAPDTPKIPQPSSQSQAQSSTSPAKPISNVPVFDTTTPKPKSALTKAFEALAALETKYEPVNARGLTRKQVQSERWRRGVTLNFEHSMTEAEWTANGPVHKGLFRMPDWESESRTDRYDEDYDMLIGPKLEVWVELQGVCGFVIQEDGTKEMIVGPGGSWCGPAAGPLGSPSPSTSDLKSLRSIPYTTDGGTSVRDSIRGGLFLSRFGSRNTVITARTSGSGGAGGPSGLRTEPASPVSGTGTPRTVRSTIGSAIGSTMDFSYSYGSTISMPRDPKPGNRKKIKNWWKGQKLKYREVPRRLPYQSPVLTVGQKFSQRFIWIPEQKGYKRPRSIH